MLIEVGKKYIDASGNIVELLEYTTKSDYPFEDTQDGQYDLKGKYYGYVNHRFNLICEVNEDIYTAYKQDLITKKEFLNKHFELYGGMTLEEYNVNAKN